MKTDDELRQLLQEYTVINDGYLVALNLKDATILRLTQRVDELEEENRKLRNEVFAELPVGAEVSQ